MPPDATNPQNPGARGPGTPSDATASRPRPNYRPLPKVSLHPKRVRGGIRLGEAPAASPGAWLARRWLGVLTPIAGPAVMGEGQAYATQGQTRSMAIEPGRVVAAVQGRAETPYTTLVAFTGFDHDRWERVVEVLSAHPAHAARLFAGELPMAAEELLEGLGLALLPTAGDVRLSCSCEKPAGAPSAGEARACKHAACVWLLVGERLARDPFAIFTLRGLEEGDLIERLRARRAIAGGMRSCPPIYAQHVTGASDASARPLTPEGFWNSNGLDEADVVVEPPKVSHPLLRRLGSSPFAGSTLPLIGLLATCYELAGQDALADRGE